MPETHNGTLEQLIHSGLFRERERARYNLDRIAARLPADICAALPPLLAESPDPDQALNLLERLVSLHDDELLAVFTRHKPLLHYILAIFGYSCWLGEALIHNAEIIHSLGREKNLERSLAREDFRGNFSRFRSRSMETDVALLLARFRKREYVRITLRDVLGIATLAETTAEISALSDVLIEEALREAESRMQKRYGPPQYQDANGRLTNAGFSVLSLGKLGGNELNYSSDVDLLYLYADTESSSLSLREYFVRQAQLLTEILSCVTHEGPVFRIDLRLRPQGSEGEPAVGLKAALNYYAHVAHDWERQALIKVRYSAGDLELAREFIRGVQPFIYTEEVNFEALETAVNTRSKIGAHRQRRAAVRREPGTLNLKLDRGGIRDIEFLVQCLQRVYGGAETWLRSGGTLFSLQKLHDKGHISSQDFHELTVAYEFLRRVEHRLQMQRGQQLHQLPSSSDEMQVLCRAVGQAANAGVQNLSDGKAFPGHLKSRMASVAQIYDCVIHSQKEKSKSEPSHRTPSPAVALHELSFSQLLQRISQDSPVLEKIVASSGPGLHARRSLHRFLSSAITSPERYSALLENPQAVQQAVALFETSEYLTDLLVRHPDAIRVLNRIPDSSTRVLPDTYTPDPFAGLSAPDGAEVLAELRQIYRTSVFASAAQDVLAVRSVYESLLETTLISDAVIACALRVAGGQHSLAVFALGRLGTCEFDISSDADLLFVRAPEIGEDVARGQAEKLLHALSAYTKEGTVFAVDPRLRPHGGQGELVVTPAQLAKYLAEEAQPWEALTYTKLRFIAGREDVAAEVLPLTRERITQLASGKTFIRAVAEMRTKVEKSNRHARSFKLAAGGFYDIDFLVSLLVLKHSKFAPGNTDSRLAHLSDAEVLQPQAFAVLRHAALLYRTTDHVVRLVTGRARAEVPSAEHARKATEDLVGKILGRAQPQGLHDELRQTAREVRKIFSRYFEEHDCALPQGMVP